MPTQDQIAENIKLLNNAFNLISHGNTKYDFDKCKYIATLPGEHTRKYVEGILKKTGVDYESCPRENVIILDDFAVAKFRENYRMVLSTNSRSGGAYSEGYFSPGGDYS